MVLRGQWQQRSPARVCVVIAKFHYTGPTGPDQTKSGDFVRDPGLRPGSREKVRAGPCGSVWVRSGPVGARVVEFSLNASRRTAFLVNVSTVLACHIIKQRRVHSIDAV